MSCSCMIRKDKPYPRRCAFLATDNGRLIATLPRVPRNVRPIHRISSKTTTDPCIRFHRFSILRHKWLSRARRINCPPLLKTFGMLGSLALHFVSSAYVEMIVAHVLRLGAAWLGLGIGGVVAGDFNNPPGVDIWCGKAYKATV
jgi:hypothetical protein